MTSIVVIIGQCLPLAMAVLHLGMPPLTRWLVRRYWSYPLDLNIAAVQTVKPSHVDDIRSFFLNGETAHWQRLTEDVRAWLREQAVSHHFTPLGFMGNEFAGRVRFRSEPDRIMFKLAFPEMMRER